jgi:hypothetical protein
MGRKLILWETNTKINHRRTELCNISIFGSILLPVCSEVEWVQIVFGIMFVGMEPVLWETHAGINRRRRQLRNISTFGNILAVA